MREPSVTYVSSERIILTDYKLGGWDGANGERIGEVHLNHVSLSLEQADELQAELMDALIAGGYYDAVATGVHSPPRAGVNITGLGSGMVCLHNYGDTPVRLSGAHFSLTLQKNETAPVQGRRLIGVTLEEGP